MCIPVRLAFFIRLTVWGFMQVLACISSSFLPVTGWYVDIHPHCFQFGVIISKTFVDIPMQSFGRDVFLFLSGKYLTTCGVVCP